MKRKEELADSVSETPIEEIPAQMTRKQIVKDIGRITIPLTFLNALSTVTNVMEAIFVSKLGPDELQGAYLVTIYLNFIAALTQFTIQSQPYISEQYGLLQLEEEKKDAPQKKEISAIVKQSWVLAFAVALPGSAMLVAAEPLARNLLKYSAQSVTTVRDIALPLAIAVPFQSMVLVDQITVQTTGHEKLLFLMAMQDTFFGIFFNYCLVGGNLGFPQLGAMSIGVVSGARMILNWILYKLYFALSPDLRNYHIYRGPWRGSKRYAWEIFKEGIPLFVIAAATAATRIPITAWIQGLGGDRTGVMQVAISWSNIFRVIPNAIATATGIIISRLAQQYSSNFVRFCGLVGILGALITVVIPAILYPIIPLQLISPFAAGMKLSPIIEQNLPWIFLGLAVNLVLQTYQNSLVNNLQNMHKTLVPGIVTATVMLVALPFSYLAANQFGGDIWGMNIVDTVSTTIICGLMLLKWQAETRDNSLLSRVSNCCCSFFGKNKNTPEGQHLLGDQTKKLGEQSDLQPNDNLSVNQPIVVM